MNKDKHRQRHVELHDMLDELSADFIGRTGKLPSQTTVMELMEWSCEQMKTPSQENAPLDSNRIGKSPNPTADDVKTDAELKVYLEQVQAAFEPIENEFMATAKRLSERIGYGRMIQLIQQEWRKTHKEKYGVELGKNFFKD